MVGIEYIRYYLSASTNRDTHTRIAVHPFIYVHTLSHIMQFWTLTANKLAGLF